MHFLVIFVHISLVNIGFSFFLAIQMKLEIKIAVCSPPCLPAAAADLSTDLQRVC